MTNTLLNVLFDIESSLIPRADPLTVIVTDEYVTRFVIQSFVIPSSSSIEPATMSETRNRVVEERRTQVKHRIERSVGRNDVHWVEHQPIAMTWWQTHSILQPDASIQLSMSKEFVVLLHWALCHWSCLLAPPVDESRLLTQSAPCPQIALGTSVVKPLSTATSSMTRDPFYTILRHLEALKYKTVVIIDWLNRSLLAGLYAYHRRLRDSRERPKDIYITSQPSPTSGLSMQTVTSILACRYHIDTPIMMSNLLFCLPMLIDVGLPPIAMLQWSFLTDPLEVLSSAVATVTTPLVVEDDVVDLAGLITVFQALAHREKESLTDAWQAVIHRKSEMPLRQVADISVMSMDNYADIYYDGAPPDHRREIVLAYITGLNQLASVCRGKSLEAYISTSIHLTDAPLMATMLPYLRQAAQRCRYITLPTEALLRSEGVESVRKLNRLWPIYNTSLAR